MRRAFTPIELISTRKRGFTLIELLVVISIIALLISILLPVLGTVRNTALDSACLSNQRQNAIGLYTFATDNKNKLPRANTEADLNIGIYAIWHVDYPKDVQSERYVGHGLLMYRSTLQDARTFYCPRNEDDSIRYDEPNAPGGGWAAGVAPHKGGLPAGQRYVQTHYHYRSFLDEDSNTWRRVDLDRDRPSETALMADNFADPARGVGIHHRSGYNVAYADGHASFVRDNGFQVRDYNGGSLYVGGDAAYRLQHEVWRDLLSP